MILFRYVSRLVLCVQEEWTSKLNINNLLDILSRIDIVLKSIIFPFLSQE